MKKSSISQLRFLYYKSGMYHSGRNYKERLNININIDRSLFFRPERYEKVPCTPPLPLCATPSAVNVHRLVLLTVRRSTQSATKK